MYKPKQVGAAASVNVWDAHVQKAASSPVQAREYKRSNYMLDTNNVMAKRIKDGDAVSQNYLSGMLRERLIKYHGLDDDDFIKYGK